MLYRAAGNQYTLLFITFSILLGTAGIMTKQIHFLTDNFGLDFIPAEINLEENIAILVAAFGVFLEHRSYLLVKIYPEGIPENIKKFDVYSHNIGVMFIFVAIFVVALDLFFLALNTWGIEFPALKYWEITILFCINGMTALMFVMFFLKACREAVR